MLPNVVYDIKIEIYVLGKELHSKLLERASPILLRETQ